MNLETVKELFESHEIETYWDEDEYLVFKVDNLIGITQFIPIAIEYWENYSELIAPQTCYIINLNQERSKEFFVNLDSELEQELD